MLRLRQTHSVSGSAAGREVYKVDLSLQMAECEANYLRLRKLLGEPQAEQRFMVSRSGQDWLQIFQVTENSRYTTTLRYRQIPLMPAAHWLSMPCLTVRIYHDAQLAEVLAWEGHWRLRPRYIYPNSRMFQTDEKWQINRFLGECLVRCLEQGRCVNDISLPSE